MRVTTIVCLVLGTLAAGSASALSVGGAVFGGPSWPIAQDDNGAGAVFGIRVPVSLITLVTVEPYYARGNYGDVSDTVAGYARAGYDVNTFGINVALGGAGLIPGFYPLVGIGSYGLSRDGSPDQTKVGYNVGIGLGLGLPMGLNLDVRGEFVAIDLGDTSRKFVTATAAVGYKFLGLP